MAEKTTNNTSNSDENKSKKKVGSILGFAKRHKFITIIILVTIVIIILSLSDYETKKQNAKENPNDPKNGPAAANEFINDVYIDEKGILRTEKSVRELWNELKEKGNAITKYLSSSQELAKLLSASMATDYPDTRGYPDTSQSPDDPIDWSKYDINIDSTEVQGIVKFKRALDSNKTITMTYLPKSEFQKKMNAYNRSGKDEDRDEALKYFTIERTLANSSSSSSSSGLVDLGPRTYNSDTFNVGDNINIKEKVDGLNNRTYDAIQGCCFDGKYIIISTNKGKKGKSGGRIYWVNAETKQCENSYVDIDAEGGHMEGITYDSKRKVVLCIVKNKRILQIDNQTKQKIGYVNVKQSFRQLAYSVSTNQLIGFNSGKNTITFMEYNGSEYEERKTVKLNNAHFTNIQGMSCDGQVIYLSDSRPSSEMSPSNYRVWVYDFNGNRVEEHSMGTGFMDDVREVENSYVDKNGNLWLVMPFEVAKVKGYRGNPVDWENSVAANVGTSGGNTSSNTKVEEILEYACSWVGKIGYDSGASGELREGGKTDCGFFVYHVYKHFGLMDHYVSPKKWKKGAPGTEEIGNDLANASPGDIIWKKTGVDKKTGEDRGHVSIYLGKGKRVHSTPGHGINVADISNSAVDKIFHFTAALPKDPTAYFDPETEELHSSKTDNSSTTGNTSNGFSVPKQPETSSQTTTSNAGTSGQTTTSNAGTSGTSTNANSNNSKVSGEAIVQEAEKYVQKIPYVYGNQYLDQRGADCSGFAWAILTKLGLITWERGPDTVFRDKGTEVKDISEAVSGDILCFNGHIAIFKGKKGDGMNGYMVEALNKTFGIVNNRKVSQQGLKLITIRRFTNNASGSTTSTTALGPVNTDEIFGQFSEETRQIILEHRNDFNKNNFKEFISNFQGGYEGYLQSLGGVFAKYAGKSMPPSTVTDAGTFQEIAEYTWGLFAIWGFDYNNGKGKTFWAWGKDNPEVASSAFYPGGKRGETHSTGHIDDICSDPNKPMRTNCNYGSNAFLQKCGLTEDKNFTTHWKRGEHIDNLEDLQIGDLVHFFSSDGGWHHVAVVGEIDPELGPILYDSGNRFIRTGNYKFPLKGKTYSNYAYWKGRRFFDIDQSTSGQIGTGTSSNSNAKYVFKVKVATWEESREKVKSTDSSEDKKEEPNHSMNAKTIPYQDIVAQYRMPFNYLWTMLLYSNNDKNYVFDLADQVRNSQIEITIHDNLQDTTTVVTESHLKKNHYEGEADVKFNYTNTIITEAPTVQPPFSQPQATVKTSQGSLTQHGKGTADSSESYKKTTTTRNIVNTLDVSLTLADTWCVKFEKKYEYDGTKKDSSNSSTTYDDIVSEDTVSPISNSTLLNNVINDAQNNAIKALIDQGKTASIDSKEVSSSTEDITTTITDRKSSTKTDTITKKYTAKPEKFYTEETPKFAIVFNKHYNARSNILGAKAWFFEALESNADTANMVDLTKYLMYKATGTAIDEVKDFFVAFNKLKQNYTDVSDGGTGETGGTSGIDGNPGKVYDFLLSKGVPAVGAAAIMGNIENESNFSPTVVNSIGASGLCQWLGGRATALKEFAKTKNTDWTDLNTQLEFMWRELDTSYTKVKNTIMSAIAEKDLEYATWYWGSWFEIYDSANQVGYETSRQWKEEKERYDSAQKWYNSWKQQHTASSSSATGGNNSTDISQAIVSKANANSTPWPGKDMCLQWVDDVYSKAGITPERKSTAFLAWKAHGISTDKNSIPIGAAVYGTGANSAGAGHVGIYIGNGKVVDSVSSGINTSTLEQWISWQTDTIEGHRGWLGWGWEDGNRTRGLK